MLAVRRLHTGSLQWLGADGQPEQLTAEQASALVIGLP
ncbi:putative transposase-like protein [Advenella mimigardefordensis DPN7]|uniref:Putative transposase-like protein n=1 Tax=Advenella mimigardefordensis (strain DSM 17166 / LMG 22922 / DPN7) TaxID=1247726 RepID=W0PFP4_ADVMD|nr:putative transposase-like protein [Advenella mimigardefordensis DPN7]